MKDLTHSVCEILINRILHGDFRPGEKLPSERDFAEKYSISRITVRRAFFRLETAGIIVRKRPNGTFVADSFKAHSGALESVGLITALPNEFSGSFVEAVSNYCEKEDLLLALGTPSPNTLESQLKIAARMASKGIKNLIVWGAEKGHDLHFFERLRILGVNLVFYDQIVPGAFADYVGLDNKTAVESLFAEAVKRGSKKFIFLTYGNLNLDSGTEREEAFRTVLKNSGMPGKIIFLPYRATLQEKESCRTEILTQMGDDTAVIAMNAPILHEIFYSPVEHGTLYCIDGAPDLNRLNAIGYCQPIREMAEESVQMLKNQCIKGNKWKSVHKRFTGEITDSPKN